MNGHEHQESLRYLQRDISAAAYINNELQLASVLYGSEYAPGYRVNGVGFNDSTFKLYKVARGDDAGNNPDYANWGLMIPYGVPYEDINNNGIYDASIDKPGVKNAVQTIFICLTDAFPENHSTSQGFGGGTFPMNAEKHLTAWSYDNINNMSDVQFLKIEIVNKGFFNWEKTFFGIVCDSDLGDAYDDFTGCDVNRNLGYSYNMDNQDGTGSRVTYGANPPAVGFDFLKGAVNKSVTPNLELNMTAFHYMQKSSQIGAVCEFDPNTSSQAYNFIRGLKRDSTPFINPLTMQPTKFVYSGDPETGAGWTQYTGKINNCEGALSGELEPAYAGEIRFVMSSGAENLTIVPGEKQAFIIAQMIARGSNNLNSVTKLKQLSDHVQNFYDNNYTIRVNPISTEVPNKFSLHQNYPNPFNPTTKIKFDVRDAGLTSLKIYDINGKEVAVLVNQNFAAGTYEYEFNASNLSSGIYFYTIESPNFSQTRKMSLIK